MSTYEREVSVKVYYVENQQNKEIRKFTVETQLAGNYEYILGKIRQVFTDLLRKDLELFYQDLESDFISISSDIELQQAFECINNGCLKLYVKVKLSKPSVLQQEHVGVLCDGCDSKIYGSRFKCTQCYDYDLCSVCQQKGEHPLDHEMLCITVPRLSKRLYYCQFPFSHHLGRNTCRGRDRKRFKSCPFKGMNNNTATEKNTDSEQCFKNCHSEEQAANDSSSDQMCFEETIKLWMSMLGLDPEIALRNCQQSANPDQPKKFNFREKLEEVIKHVNEAFGVDAELMHDMAKAFMRQCNINCDEECARGDEKENAVASTNEVSGKKEEVNQASSFETKDFTIEKQSKAEAEPTDVAQNCMKSPQGVANNILEAVKPQTNLVDPLPQQTSELQQGDLQNGLGKFIGQLFPQLVAQEPPSNTPNDFIFVEKESNNQKESKLEKSLRQMEAMGFDNEGGWLRQLLISKDCSIDRVLDALSPAK